MKQVFVSTLFVFCFAAIGFTAEPGVARFGVTTTDAPDREALFKNHRLCARMSETRSLSRDEVAMCQLAYLHLKLTFLDDVTPESYSMLTAPQRAEVNRAGYRAYMRWLGRSS